MKNYLSGFETERLIIRKLTRRDIPVWADFFLDKNCFEFIGLDDDKGHCEHAEFWMERQFGRYRNGYASEAAVAFRDFAFENKLADSLITVINVNNGFSLKVTERLGFKKEDEIICMNKRSYLFRLGREEWQKFC